MSATPVGTVAVRACASCHRPLRPDARFCTACGAPAQPDATVTLVEGAQGRSRAEARPREPRPAVLHPAFGDATPAGPGRRVLAYALDAVAVGAVAGGLLAWTGSWLLAALVVVELAVGLLVWEAHTGRTLGNTVLGLRTAREETPYSVGPARGFLRGLVLAAGHAAAGLGQWLVVASGAFDRTGRAQAWHDRVGRAVVVDVRAHERAVEAAADAAERAGAVAVPAAPRAGVQVGAAGVPRPQQGAVPGAPAGAVPDVPTPQPPRVGAAPQPQRVGPVPAAAVPVPPVAPTRPPAPVAAPDGDAASAPSGRRAARAAAAQPPAVPAGHQAQPQQPPAAAAQSAAEAASVGIRPVVPAQPAPEPAAPRLAHQAQPSPFLVTLDTGQVMSVTGPGLIGRAPRPVAGERCDHVIVVDDPERSVSRTHARFGIDDGTFWVSDAGSGNGTTLRLPGGRVVPVPADQRVLVPSGSTIQVGDRGVRIDAPGAARG
ncbi:RDD family protein [Cellulomonas sp.]|uniref:RDD family protein n=1 Tax=Cellulomonas sp. TaxID=40001 RepID=UPI002D2B6295|nr:RDD family protein [Cellulomonas sp.]HYQ77302.1 RDD family protein [Cellulomonas sp.]